MRALTRAPVIAALLCAACNQAEAPHVPAAAPAPVAVDLGSHRAEFLVPPGWQHADRGDEQLFKREIGQISLADLGPTTAEGYVERIRAARELFRADQWEDAHVLLSSLEPWHFFESRESAEKVRRAWRSVTRIRRQRKSDPPGKVRTSVLEEVEAAFEELLGEMRELMPPALEALAKITLPQLGYDEMRAIATEVAMTVSGKPAIRIDTWDRLSHRQRRSYLFVSSEGRLLCMRMKLGRYEVMEPAFDALIASLAIAPLQASRGGA